MQYLTQGRANDRIEKLIAFKYRADVDPVLYWHYLSIKGQLLKDLEAEAGTTSGIQAEDRPQEDLKG